MTINTEKLGWLVAATLAGAMTMGALSGFQGNTAPKFATVDLGKVFDGSSLAAANTDLLESARKARASALEFIFNHRSMDTNDASRYATLATKTVALTPAEKTEFDKVKANGEEATRKYNELSTKNPLTDADKVALQDYGAKTQANQTLLQTLRGTYENDLQNMSGDLREKTLDRVRDVVKNIASKGGYTVVFSTQAAPYAANDLTNDALNALKK